MVSKTKLIIRLLLNLIEKKTYVFKIVIILKKTKKKLIYSNFNHLKILFFR